MAQRKSTPTGSSARPGSSTSRPNGKPGGGGRGNTGKSSAPASKTAGTRSAGHGPATKPPARRKKSIVNQKQTPWGLIITTAAVVLFAAAVVGYVVVTHKSSDGTNAADPYRQPELAAAKQISGLTYKVEPDHMHQTGTVKYDSSPPRGGNHNGFWADCSGTVYANPIANENAVHMLEHGAVWITYNASQISGTALTTLKGYVTGIDRMALSPYPGQDSPISLQAWGYQLKVKTADDPRIDQFIGLLKNNKTTTPEYGASCTNTAFKQNPSTFGHPSNG